MVPQACSSCCSMHLARCRWGYKTLADVEEVVSAYSAADIPLEVIWTDIDYSEWPWGGSGDRMVGFVM